MRPYRRTGDGRFKQALAVLLSLGILAIGTYYLGTPGLLTLVPPEQAAEQPPLVAGGQDEVDVAGLYERLFSAWSSAGGTEIARLTDDRRRSGQQALARAQGILAARGESFLAEASRSLQAAPAPTGDTQGPDRGQTPVAGGAQPAADLALQGRRLAHDLRLLVLARTSLAERVDWRDLPRLEADLVQARFDSLLVRRRARGVLEPSLVEVQSLIRRLNLRTRQLEAGLALQSLLDQERWEPGWERRIESAVDALAGLQPGMVRQLRDDALLLARFKRAEHATAVAGRAFADDHGLASLQTPAVADILPELLARVQPEHPGGEPPELLRATVGFYSTMAAVSGPAVGPEQLAAASDEMARNRAVAFDPAVYGDHRARLSFRWFAKLIAAGVPIEALPAGCLGEAKALEHLAFLDLLADPPDADGWRELASVWSDPFLTRWSLHLAGDSATDGRARHPATTALDARPVQE